MEISYKGGSSLIFSTKKTTLLVDPKVSPLGLKDPIVTDSVEVLTDNRYILDGARLIIDGPGDYEVGDFSISGTSAHRHTDDSGTWPLSTIYRLETNEFRIGILGHVVSKVSDEQLEAIGVVDILVIPVGGNGFTLDPHDAAAITRQIDPKVVIPVHYEDAKASYEVPQLPLEQFIKELNLSVETVDKYKLKNAGVLPETLSIVALNRV